MKLLFRTHNVLVCTGPG